MEQPKSDATSDVEIDIPVSRNRRATDGKGRLRVVLPWAAIIALLGWGGWHMVDEKAPSLDGRLGRLEEREATIERRLDASDARANAQFDEVIRRLARIEDRLDRR